MIAVSFGGGANSTALLIGLYERGIRPDEILFADTGAEFADTYAHVDRMCEWTVAHGMPEIVRVKYERETLEANCLRQCMLPSLAYGHRGCSQKYKIEPQEKYFNNHLMAKEAWAKGERVQKMIGYDASEGHRLKIFEDKKYTYLYPLVGWGWDREKCLAVAKAEGLCCAKSACFFCPATRPAEVLAMRKTHPDLLDRALALEENAELTSIKGLGGRFSWRELLDADAAQQKMFGDTFNERGCMCHE